VRKEKSNKVWNLLTLALARGADEFASSLLFELGTTGIVTLEEDSRQVKFGAYFDQSADPCAISAAVEAEFLRAGRRVELFGVSIAAIPDQDWMEKWKEGFEPTAIGDRLMIAPSWKLPTGDIVGREVIQIDPGMAFGTGTHETTRLCLQFIERYWNGGRLLDVGTGTGILAIAAALLQPKSRVVAIDVDPLAVQVARQNSGINRVSSSVEVIEGQPRDFVGQGFDIVVANLTAEVIISLIAELAGCVKPGGLLILSGILTELSTDVEHSVQPALLSIVERCEAGEWSAIVAGRREISNCEFRIAN
jgi:ribosomal protein L11 methyltransferase